MIELVATVKPFSKKDPKYAEFQWNMSYSTRSNFGVPTLVFKPLKSKILVLVT